MSNLTISRATFKKKMAIKKATTQLAIETKAKMMDDVSALRKVTKPPKNIQKEDILQICHPPEHPNGNYKKTKHEQTQSEFNKKWINQVSTDIVTNRFKFNEPKLTNNNIMLPPEQKNRIKISKNKFDMGD